ncbi:protein of unknown function (plasmid) [Pararobbsia alpina]|uniref:hypothetical protein n=1 Tax=Pararobbsia alpina TaxID=621374 RepID=UPI0039A6EEBF
MNEYAQRIVLLTAEEQIVRLGQQLVDSNQRMLRTLDEGGDVQASVFAAATLCREMAAWKRIRRQALKHLARAALGELISLRQARVP